MVLSKPEFSLIIPAYNECTRIQPTLKDVLGFFEMVPDQKYEMLIVMDGCNDGTPEAVKEILSDHPCATTLIFPNRLGKGGAIVEALKHVRGDVVAFIDADGSIPSWELGRLIGLTQQYDLVIGSRYQKDSKVFRGRPLIRIMSSRAFNVLLKLLFWKLHGMKDTQCGVKVFRSSLVDSIREDILIADFAFDVNLIYSALRSGFSVKEVGITWFEKDGGKLSSGLAKQVLVMLLSLLRLRIYYSKFRRILDSMLFQKLGSFLYSRFQS